MNEQLLADSYRSYCETLLAIRQSGDWKDWFDDWGVYVESRWGLSKSRAKLLCDFAKLRNLALLQGFATLPDTPEQCKPLLALPQKQWLETWELVCDYCKPPITAANVAGCLEHFGIFANKRIPPDVLKGMRVRRAAKTLAEVGNGEQLVGEIGPRGLGKNWNKAVEVVIDADQARLNAGRK